VAGSCEHGNEPLDSMKDGNFLTGCPIISFSRRSLLHRVSLNCASGWYVVSAEQRYCTFRTASDAISLPSCGLRSSVVVGP
jgi:hypothetical protein